MVIEADPHRDMWAGWNVLECPVENGWIPAVLQFVTLRYLRFPVIFIFPDLDENRKLPDFLSCRDFLIDDFSILWLNSSRDSAENLKIPIDPTH